MNVSSVLGLIGAVFGILSLVAGAAVYLRASYAKARIDALNAEIEEEKRRSSQLRVDITALQGENKVLEAKVVALGELVTQRQHLENLKASILNLERSVEIMRQDLARYINAQSRGAA